MALLPFAQMDDYLHFRIQHTHHSTKTQTNTANTNCVCLLTCSLLCDVMREGHNVQTREREKNKRERRGGKGEVWWGWGAQRLSLQSAHVSSFAAHEYELVDFCPKKTHSNNTSQKALCVSQKPSPPPPPRPPRPSSLSPPPPPSRPSSSFSSSSSSFSSFFFFLLLLLPSVCFLCQQKTNLDSLSTKDFCVSTMSRQTREVSRTAVTFAFRSAEQRRKAWSSAYVKKRGGGRGRKWCTCSSGRELKMQGSPAFKHSNLKQGKRQQGTWLAKHVTPPNPT